MAEGRMRYTEISPSYAPRLQSKARGAPPAESSLGGRHACHFQCLQVRLECGCHVASALILPKCLCHSSAL
eukprot:832117-Pyramimonas_sp.AAC.1